MVNWPTKKLGEICERVSLTRAPLNSWPYIEIGDINLESKTIILKDKKSIKGAVVVPKDIVLVSRVRPTRGAIVFIDKNYVVSSAFTILKAKKPETSSRFLFHWLSGSKGFLNYLQRKQKGSNYPSVREKDIFEFKIPFPPLKTQKQIVERLDKIAEAQKLNDELIQKTDELFQSLLHKEIQSQKGWETKKLEEIVDINYGKGLEKSYRKENGKYYAYGSNGPVYRTDKILIEELTIIVGRKGGAGLLWMTEEPSWPIDTTFYLRVKDRSNTDLNFIYFSLQTKNLPKLAIVTAVPGINRSTLYNVKILFPPLKIQKQIVGKLSAAQDYKKQLLEQRAKLKELFESVLSKAFKEI